MNQLPSSPGDDPRRTSHACIPARILVAIAFFIALAFGLLIRIPGEMLLVWDWVYIFLAVLPVIFLLIALAVKLHQRIQSRIPRLIAVWGVCFLAIVIFAIDYSICAVYNEYGTNPAAYYTNPETGNRLVIMKAVDMEKLDENPEKIEYIYGAYPMRNKYFYYPERGGTVPTLTGIDYVEWNDEGTAAFVHIIDRDDVEQIITVDFDFGKSPEESVEGADQD